MKKLLKLLPAILLCSPIMAQLKSGAVKTDTTHNKKSALSVRLNEAPPEEGEENPGFECADANAGANVAIDCGNSTQLGTSYNSNYTYSWSPATGLDYPNAYNPNASPRTTTTYTLTMTPKPNLLVNGDFENGNNYFSSDYSFGVGNYAVPTYSVASNASSFYSWWCGTAPTSGSNMLIADGATSNGQRVWYQTISVTPNTFYAFSGQFLNTYSTSGANDPHIVVKINGTTVATETLGFNGCGWQTVSGGWTAGSGVYTATLAIYSDPGSLNNGNGNDFAIDNLALTASNCPIATSTVTVTVNYLPGITSAQGWSPYGQSYAFDKGYLSILQNYDVKICLFYGSDISVNVDLISNQSTNIQWYRNGTAIPNATNQTYAVNDASFPVNTANPRVTQYTVLNNATGCMTAPLNVTHTLNPSGITVGQRTSTSVEWIDQRQFPSMPANITASNFDMSFAVSSPGQISAATSNSAFTNIVSVPAVFPTTVTLIPKYYNYGCVMEGNDRIMTFDGSSNPLVINSKKLQHQSGSTSELNQTKGRVTITPNPAKNVVVISSREIFRKIQLYDGNGMLKQLYTRQGQLASLDVSALPPGIYFLTVIFDTSVKTEKLMIVK